MNLFAHVVLIGWIPVVVVLFAALPARRAVIASFLLAWLFLPMAGYTFEGLPNYTKMSATSFGVLLGVILYDFGRLAAFRPRWFDIPMIVWCIAPFFSSVSNDLGYYDGVSAAVNQTVIWGLPYLIGRMYFSDPEGLRELAVGIFIGGLIYMPLCLWEVRMSPQLHKQFYGFYQHAFDQHKRGGGFRPMVFMQHGLMVAMWMTAASLIGIWLWRTGVLRRVMGVPMTFLVPPMIVTTVLCKSAMALMLLMLGTALLFVTQWSRTTILVIALLMVPPIYIYGRVSGAYTGEWLVVQAREWFDAERARSLNFRLEQEDALAERAMEQPIFGWGGWGRAFVQDERGQRVSVPDSLWIIALGWYGIVGVSALIAMLLLPVALLWWNHPARHWSHPAAAPAAVLAVLLVLYVLDSLLNAMVNPIFVLAVGGLVAVDANVRAMRRRQAAGAAAAAKTQPPQLADEHPPVAVGRALQR